jgi:hypothetical protein
MTRHLVHIGYPKAGSTFLQHWFAAHPQIAYVHGGIAGFGNVYALAAESARDGPERLWRVTSLEELSMPRADAGTRYVDYDGIRRESLLDRQAKACAMMAELFPDAHVLIVTRGFRSMMLSSYSQYVRTGGTDDLETQMRHVGESPWQYDRVIALYRRAFGERVIVLPYELLARDAAAFRAELEQRLDLAPFPLEDSVVNRALSPVELRWYPRLARLVRRMPLGKRLSRRFVDMAFENWLAFPIAILDRIWPARPVTGALLTDEMMERVRGDADELAADPIYTPFAGDYLFEHRLKPGPPLA